MIFKVTPAGAFTTLWSFGAGGISSPFGNLVQKSDGIFYGVTIGNTGYDRGTVFGFSVATGAFIVYAVTGNDDTDVQFPDGPLVLGHDGSLYGTTQGGSGQQLDGAVSNFTGTAFSITPSGEHIVIHAFPGEAFPAGSTDGKIPMGPLALGSDGNLYGRTVAGGGAWLRHDLQDRSGEHNAVCGDGAVLVHGRDRVVGNRRRVDSSQQWEFLRHSRSDRGQQPWDDF